MPLLEIIKIISQQYWTELLNRSIAKQKFYINTSNIKTTLETFLIQHYKYSKSFINTSHPNLISFLKSAVFFDNHIQIIDNILIDLMGISFFSFNLNPNYQKYIRAIIDYRIITTPIKSINEYSQYIKRNKKERNLLIWYLTPSTSYFFRDNLLKEIALISSHLTKHKDLRILVLWCSTWSEVCSLTYALQTANIISYKILATDINIHTLKYAENGYYEDWLIATLPTDIAKDLFDQNYISDKYKQNIIFQQLDILNLNSLFLGQKFDLIIARNIIKYFNNKKQALILNNITKVLSMNWLLMVWIQDWSNKDIDPWKYISLQKIGKYTYKYT